MTSLRRARPPGTSGGRYSKNPVGRTRSTKNEAGQLYKPSEVYDFPDDSDAASMGKLSENEDEELCESFDPPLHSTAIDADEAELSRHCRSCTPLGPRGKGAKGSSNLSETEESENDFVKIRTRKLRRFISNESESGDERDSRMEDKPAERVSSRQQEATASSELSEKAAEFGAPKKTGPPSAKSSVGKKAPATARQPKTQKKEMFCDKRKKSRNEAIDSDGSDCALVWCLKGKKSSDVMELDVVLSALEEAVPEYEQSIDSEVCKEAINKFHSNLKKELIKTLTEVQKLKTLKRKNAKMISEIEKKRRRLIEVQDELLRLEPQLKQLQIKYRELQERKSSLRDAASFLSNLRQLHQDYAALREREPPAKETYGPSSLPALLLKGRALLGAQSHLQSINCRLERLLDQA